MIYEYALDPEFLLEIVDKKDLQNMLKQSFGLGKPCIFSGYPKDAYNVLQNSITIKLENYKGKDKAKLQERYKQIAELYKTLTSTRCIRNNANIWNGDFIHEHQRYPFHGILVKNSAPTHKDNIVLDCIRNQNCAIFLHNTSELVLRNKTNLANTLKPLFTNASEFTFIDPYFYVDSRFITPYLNYFQLIQSVSDIRSRGPREIIIICGVHKENIKSSKLGKRTSISREIPYINFKESCESQITHHLPSGIKLKIYRIKEIKDSEEIHNRYILTNIGGVLFGHGTDISSNPNAHDDIILLNSKSFEYWKRVYTPNSSYFDWSEGVTEIENP